MLPLLVCSLAVTSTRLAAGVPAATAAASVAATAEALAATGCVRVNGALSAETSDALVALVNDELDAALDSMRNAEDALDMGGSSLARFGNVLKRKQRHDLKLDLSPPVRLAVSELVDSLGPTLASCLGGHDAVLYELAALVSDPGSPQQPFHPDTPFREDQGVAVLTAFVALQQIDGAMGPTTFMPGTHTAEAHAAFNAGDDGEARLALLRSRPCWRATLEVSSGALF